MTCIVFGSTTEYTKMMASALLKYILLMVLYFSCPAVSQMFSNSFLPYLFVRFSLNVSTAIVAGPESLSILQSLHAS